MSTVAELIERLEKAERESRELDRAIHAWLAYPMSVADHTPPAFTTSLDAALTLVPEGCWWEVRQMCAPDSVMKNFGSRNGMFSARVGHSYGEPGFPGDHDKPALALCIAALKAHPRKARQSLTTVPQEGE